MIGATHASQDDMTIHSGIGLEAALVSTNPDTRLYARLCSTPAGSEMARWLNAELKRGSEPVAIVGALAQFFVQIHAGMSQQMLEDPALPGLMHMLKAEVDERYLQIWQKSQQIVGKNR